MLQDLEGLASRITEKVDTVETSTDQRAVIQAVEAIGEISIRITGVIAQVEESSKAERNQ